MRASAHTPAQPAPIAAPLFVQQMGAGPPLLLIHGLMVSGAMYQGVVPALATRYRIIVPDLRGHGRSGALPGPYSVEQLARDLAQLLDDLHIDAAHVLGYSQGGAVAQQFARDYPRRVAGLVLACTYAYNMLSQRERLEGMLAPWFVRILGMRGWQNCCSLVLAAVSACLLRPHGGSKKSWPPMIRPAWSRRSRR